MTILELRWACELALWSLLGQCNRLGLSWVSWDVQHLQPKWYQEMFAEASRVGWTTDPSAWCGSGIPTESCWCILEFLLANSPYTEVLPPSPSGDLWVLRELDVQKTLRWLGTVQICTPNTHTIIIIIIINLATYGKGGWMMRQSPFQSSKTTGH